MSENDPSDQYRETSEFAQEDELHCLVELQAEMKLRLINAGIASEFHEKTASVKEGFMGRLYPYKMTVGDEVNLMVIGEMVAFDIDRGQSRVRYPWRTVGVVKDGVIRPTRKFSDEQAHLVADMIIELEDKKAAGELPNLNKTCDAIDLSVYSQE